MRFPNRWCLAAVILLALVAADCGGGGSSNGGGTNPPPSNVTVTISPSTSTVGFGSTQQFTATVSGSTNTAVTWSVSNSSSSSSSQIGTISSSGLYTAPVATSLSAAALPQLVNVSPGVTLQNINIPVPALNSVDSVTVTATSQADTSQSASATVALSGLSILAVGQCTQATASSLNCSAGSTGTEIARGATTYLFVAGYGIVPGTTYSISSNGADVTIPLQPSSGNFATTNGGIPAVYFQVMVGSAATLGPRNLVVTNQGNELTSFVGAVDITP